MFKIAMVGKQCAGKTFMGGAIADHFRGSVHRLKFANTHHMVQRIMGQPKNRIFMQEFSDLAKKHFGPDIFVKLFERAIADAEAYDRLTEQARHLICDDVRYPAELEKVKELGFWTVFVECDAEHRKARAEALGLVFNDEHNSETEIDGLKPYCDMLVVNNDGSAWEANAASAAEKILTLQDPLRWRMAMGHSSQWVFDRVATPDGPVAVGQ